MIKIRKGCFETNSSSTHAIIISTEKTKSYPFDLMLNIGKFGWEMDVLSYPEEKASYFYTAACSVYMRDVYDEVAEMLAPYGIHCLSAERAEFDVIYEGYLSNGGIDHISDGGYEFVRYLMEDAEHLVNFLFNDKSYVVTGNDNCDDVDYEWFQKKIAKANGYDHVTFMKGN